MNEVKISYKTLFKSYKSLVSQNDRIKSQVKLGNDNAIELTKQNDEAIKEIEDIMAEVGFNIKSQKGMVS